MIKTGYIGNGHVYWRARTRQCEGDGFWSPFNAFPQWIDVACRGQRGTFRGTLWCFRCSYTSEGIISTKLIHSGHLWNPLQHGRFDKRQTPNPPPFLDKCMGTSFLFPLDLSHVSWSHQSRRSLSQRSRHSLRCGYSKRVGLRNKNWRCIPTKHRIWFQTFDGSIQEMDGNGPNV